MDLTLPLIGLQHMLGVTHWCLDNVNMHFALSNVRVILAEL